MAARLLSTCEITVATIRSILSRAKDKLTTVETSNVSYKLFCRQCNRYYIGQTERRLDTRINEHRLALM